MYIRANPVNFSSPILALNQVLRSCNEEKLLYAVATGIGNVIRILRNVVYMG